MNVFKTGSGNYVCKLVKGKEVFFRLPNEYGIAEDAEGRKIIVLLTAHKISWDPHNDVDRVALLKHLNEKLRTTEYTDLFSELDTDTLAMLNKIYLMAKFIVNGVDNAVSATHSVTGYKQHFFDGPTGTSMSLVPTPAIYGTAAEVVDANAMEWVSNLRGKLTKNVNWTDDIAKDLWLYGTDSTFNKDTYQAHYSVNPFPTYMHFHVSTKYVHTHNVYVRVKGATVWEAPIRFDGANFDLSRPGTAAQNLEVMFKGIINNVETPMLSVITSVLYTPTI